MKVRAISPHRKFQAARKALRDFMQNPYVAARVIVGELDHILPPEVREKLRADREKRPELVKAARDRLERGIRAGAIRP